MAPSLTSTRTPLLAFFASHGQNIWASYFASPSITIECNFVTSYTGPCQQSQDEIILSAMLHSDQSPPLSRKKNLSTFTATREQVGHVTLPPPLGQGDRLLEKNSVTSGLLGARAILLAPMAPSTLAYQLGGGGGSHCVEGL